ncbi:MAG: hypothetical protein Q7O66_05785, partial [Dehalococcoidia bacterium]|nr:hypothetical protein [Dehalococcoidia bacterium]
RMSAGLHVPLSMLALVGFYAYISPRLKGLLPIIIMALAPSNLFLLIFALVGASTYPYPLYLMDGEVASFRWLSQNTDVNETLLASEMTGNIIPALAGNRVFYGHPFETIRAKEKRSLLLRFFAGEMYEQEERSFLAEYGIAYIYYGQSEREPGSFDPANRQYLQRVFANSGVAIYRVSYYDKSR